MDADFSSVYTARAQSSESYGERAIGKFKEEPFVQIGRTLATEKLYYFNYFKPSRRSVHEMESSVASDSEEVVHRVKRFKHQSYAESLKDVHLPSALDLTTFDHDIADNESHFYASLQQWRQLNLSPSFVQFANKADSLSISMPLLLHNWRDIVELWMAALDAADDEALRALLGLLQTLAHDLRTTLSPVYADLLTKLLHFLPRSIATPALTALLATLSGLFKYLLVPSIHLDLLQQTWYSFRAILPSCGSEVQRAAAEVWASVLRRLKTSAREKAALLMANNLDGLETATAWMIVFACKSVSSTLHTTSSSIFSQVVDCYLSCRNPDSLYTLLRRALSSIIHHCNGAEQFSSVADILISRFSTVVGRSPSNDVEVERVCRMLQLMSVVCSVRQGSRLSAPQLSQLASALPNIQICPLIEPALLNFSVAVLTAGDMSISMSVGRIFIVEALKVPRFGVSLLGALTELSWGGWKLVALPVLLRSTEDLLTAEPKLTLRLFASLKHSDKLGDVDIVWRRTIDVWLRERLSHWELSPDGVDELRNILALSVYVEKMPELLVGIVQRMLDVPEPEESWRSSHANSAWVLWVCMRALATSKDDSWRKQIDLGMWARTVLQRWSWSPCTLKGLASLAQSSPSIPNVLPFSETYLSLQASITSHSRSLRLSALKILSSKLVQSSSGEQDALKRCLQGEEVSLDVHGVRERVMRIGRIGQVVKGDEPLAADLCVRWLISQLKVNLRPLWSPAAEALSSLAKQFGDSVWTCLFEELQGVTRVPEAPLPRWLNDGDYDQDITDDPWEEERTWRDGSAHKMRNVITSWLDDAHEMKVTVNDQKPLDRFDPVLIETQLLSTLGQCTSLVEKHNRELIPFFLSMTENDASVSSLPRYRLNAWLALFSKLTNPKAFHSAETLFTIHRSLLSHPDRTLQTLALSCVFTYKVPNLVRHEDTLRRFLDDTLWRDELARLDIFSLDKTDRPMFVDTTIRLLFGIILEKKGRTRGGDRRAAVLSALAVCSEDELGLLVDLMLRPMGPSSQASHSDIFALTTMPHSVSFKQQIGFLNLVGEVLKHLGPKIVTHWPALLGTTLNLTGAAQARLTGLKQTDLTDENAEEEENIDADIEAGAGVDEGSTTGAIRAVRQLGLRRLADFFRVPSSFDYTAYLRASFDAIISPRLALFDQENTQAPSALLDVFLLWASRPEYVRYLIDYDERVLPKVLDCLIATNVKPAVLTRVFDIVDCLLSFSSEDGAIADSIVKPHLSLLLKNLTTLVERTKSDQHLSTPIAQRQISVLSQVAGHITDPAQASILMGLLSPLLRKPGKVVPEKVKVNLLTILKYLFALVPELLDPASPTFTRIYELLSHLFLLFRSNSARITLTSTFSQLAVVHPGLQNLSSLLESLNACSTKRMNEPDFDRRLKAFTTLNEECYLVLSARDWSPILSNALYFIQDPEELAIRTNAAFTLRRFVGVVASDAPIAMEVEPVLARIVLPSLKHTLRSKSELVRAEALGIIANAVLKCERIESLQDMRPLLAGGDDEASFFTNVHHVQIHRRTRAIRRLGEQCEGGYLRGRNLAEIFVPLVEHYIVSTASLDHLLVAEAISTLGRIAKQLSWSPYYNLVQKYIRSSKDKDDTVRVHVRTLVAILENFHFSMEEAVQETNMDVIVDGDALEGEDTAADIQIPPPVPSADVKKISDAVNMRLLPALLGYLENRDENEDSLRIPVALGIANVALHLPTDVKEAQAGKLLTVLSQALRSRSQETRDLVRETICRIVVVLGPAYLPLALRELRAALLRGPQLHVLAYAMHALLTHVTSSDRSDPPFDDLDGCIDDVVHIASEVVFGESGKDVQHEDYRTKMREVKGSASRGLDCFALSARFVSPNRISALLLPVRSVMEVTNSAKPMQHADEVLRRIAGGLNTNARLNPPELLVLCHTLISQNAKFLQEAERKTTASKKGRGRKDDYILQTKRKIVADNDYYANNSYRFVVFGLDLFTTAYRRSRFDLKDAKLLARLEPFVNLIGNTLYTESEAVIVAALKAAPCILQCPLKAIASSAPLVSRQILAIIRSIGSTESEVAQTAFKSLATILRECPTSNVKEEDLLFLLELLAPDLEEPSRQASVFTLLRAIVARKLVVPELYDVMTTVSSILVTSQSAHTRESARSLLLQFLLDYPQGAGRLQTTLTFFARNLSYEHASGRSSVLELLHAFVTKFDMGLMAKHAEMLFVALVLCIANDAEKPCRQAAAGVIQVLVRRLQEEREELLQRSVMGHLHAWVVQKEKIPLRSVAVQMYGLVVDALQRAAAPYLDAILEDLRTVADGSCALLSGNVLEGEAGEIDGEEGLDEEWRTTYQTLQGLSKVLQVFPEATTEPEKVRWQVIVQLLVFPHAWVRSAACRLLGTLFAASTASTGSSTEQVLTYDGMRDVAEKLSASLKSPHLETTMALQAVKNLFFVGKWFIAAGLSEEPAEDNKGSESDNEGDDEGDDEAEVGENPGRADALPWLFSKLSYQARSAQIARRNKSAALANWVLLPLSVLRFFAAMSSHMEARQLERFLPHILTPVYRITEEDTIRDSGMDELKTTAIELQDLVQAKVGTTVFARVYNRIRQGAVRVQQERRVARVTKVTTDPEGAAKRKIMRNVMKKESRKRKNKAFAESRGRVKRRREA